MRTKNPALTAEQLNLCRTELPQLIRAACYGDDLSGFGVRPALRGRPGEAMLCCPLTEQKLARIRRCALVKQQDVEVAPVPCEEAEHGGQLLFRVRYDFEGEDAAGEAVSLHESAVIAVTCRMQRRWLFLRKLCVTEAACCTEQDGVIHLPPSGHALHSKATWRERLGESVGEGLLEIAGEVFFELIAGLFDGV